MTSFCSPTVFVEHPHVMCERGCDASVYYLPKLAEHGKRKAAAASTPWALEDPLTCTSGNVFKAKHMSERNRRLMTHDVCSFCLRQIPPQPRRKSSSNSESKIHVITVIMIM